MIFYNWEKRYIFTRGTKRNSSNRIAKSIFSCFFFVKMKFTKQELYSVTRVYIFVVDLCSISDKYHFVGWWWCWQSILHFRRGNEKQTWTSYRSNCVCKWKILLTIHTLYRHTLNVIQSEYVCKLQIQLLLLLMEYLWTIEKSTIWTHDCEQSMNLTSKIHSQ